MTEQEWLESMNKPDPRISSIIAALANMKHTKGDNVVLVSVSIELCHDGSGRVIYEWESRTGDNKKDFLRVLFDDLETEVMFDDTKEMCEFLGIEDE